MPARGAAERPAGRLDDARADEVLCGSLAVTELGVVAYAGMPLTDREGQVLGSLCAIDASPRSWAEDELATLADLAAACSSELRLRVEVTRSREATRMSEQAQARLAVLAEVSRSLVGPSAVMSGLDTLVALLSPWLADACAVTVLCDGGPTVSSVVASGRLDEIDVPTVRRGDEVADLGEPLRGVLRGRSPDARWEHSRSCGVVLPLLGSGGSVLGALTVARGPAGCPLQADDVALLRDLALRAGLALENARLHEREAEASETLQRSLLSDVPASDNAEVVARYLPAARSAQVGGDWYDAVAQPGGATVLVIGDVMGHDLDAAGTMGQLRSLLRGVVHDRQEPPSEVLSRVDRALTGLRMRALASALVAQLETRHDDPAHPRGHVRWSSAGHLPPVLVPARGEAVLLPGTDDLLLGLDPGTDRVDLDTELEPGATLVLYTDGLVERRSCSLEQSLERLRSVLTDLQAEPLAVLCDELLARMLPGRPEDDVALLAVRLRAGTPIP